MSTIDNIRGLKFKGQIIGLMFKGQHVGTNRLSRNVGTATADLACIAAQDINHALHLF